MIKNCVNKLVNCGKKVFIIFHEREAAKQKNADCQHQLFVYQEKSDILLAIALAPAVRLENKVFLV